MKALVSVIIPVYKVEAYLDRCLNSILSQTYKELEIILVDDGSPDRCPQMCDNYAAIDNRVTVLHKENGGLSSARNAALDCMNGQYCIFVDSDDFIQIGAVDYLVKLAESNNADLVQCSFERGEKSEFVSVSDYINDKIVTFDGNKIFESTLNNVTLCGKLYRSELWRDVRMPLGMKNEDDFTTWKLYYKANRVIVSNLKLYYNYINDSGISSGLKRTPNISYPMQAYHERIDFFDTIGDKHLSDLSKWRYSLYLMIAMGAKKINAEDKETLKKEFKSIYRNVLHCKSVPLSHKTLVLLSLISPIFATNARQIIRRVRSIG